MSDELDQHPSLREHLGLRERVTVLEGGQVNITQALNRIEARQLTQQAPAPSHHDSVILAVHDLAKSVRERQTGGGVGVGTMILVGFGMFGVGVACFLIGKVFF